MKLRANPAVMHMFEQHPISYAQHADAKFRKQDNIYVP